jgi:hypothetical protein
MRRLILKSTTMGVLAVALHMSAQLASAAGDSRCYYIYDWFTRTYRTFCPFWY